MRRGRPHKDFTKNKREHRIVRGDERRILYIGLDESNHGGDPEVCAAVFSTLSEDSKYHTYIYGKKYESLLERLNITPEIDYKFLMLYKNQLPENQNKLVLSAPSLIIPYLENLNFQFNEIRTMFDGKINGEDKQFILKRLDPYARKVTCEGFIKYREEKARKKGTRKRKVKEIIYQQPRIVPMADTLANHLYNQTLKQINDHPKRIFLEC